MIPALNEIHSHDNPLEFPPPEVLQEGTGFVLEFFRNMIAAKSRATGSDYHLNGAQENVAE